MEPPPKPLRHLFRFAGTPLGVIVIAKLLVDLATLAAITFPADQPARVPHRVFEIDPGSNFLLRLSSWDVAHYALLSTSGYEPGSSSCAFYPLWPAAIRIASTATGINPVIASLLLANALSLAALWFFYRLAADRLGPAQGRDALILLLAFPGALFFSVGYTESLFLLLVTAVFWALDRERWFWVVALSFLMPCCKAIGVFILVPLAWRLFERRPPWARWLTLLAPLAGYALYFAQMYAWTGNPFDGFQAQQHYPNAPSIANILNLPAFARAFLNIGSLDGMLDGILDRLLFLLVLVLLPFVWRLDRAWFFYTLVAGLIPAASNWFFSYRRFFIVLFPIFLVLAQLNNRITHLPQGPLLPAQSTASSNVASPCVSGRWLFWYYVVLLTALQIWAIRQFLYSAWAG